MKIIAKILLLIFMLPIGILTGLIPIILLDSISQKGFKEGIKELDFLIV